MAYEIERKFLLNSDAWREQVTQTLEIKQAYFCNTEKASLRVRVSDQNGYLSSKTMTREIRRHEFEYAIPLHDAEFMIENMCMGSPIIKQRHLVKIDRHLWEIDEFEGDNQGLIVAEIELAYEDEPYTRPEWLGQEVSADGRYMNMSLVLNPFKLWTT
jgi:adenylate cyclase